MAKLSLMLVMTLSPVAPICVHLFLTTFGVKIPHIVAGSVFLPVMVLGIRSWLKTHCFAREWPVVLCVLIIWAGLLYAGNLEEHAGLRFAVYLTVALPCTALIVEHRLWWQCAKVFVLACVVTLGLVVYFQYEARNSVLQWSVFRLGNLRAEEGQDFTMDPNRLGAQFAFAAVLAFVLYLRGEAAQRVEGTTVRSVKFSLGWTGLLSFGCIMTASRSAFLAWFVGMGLLVVWGTRKLPARKCKGLLVGFCMLLLVTMFVWVAADVTPWAGLQERFGGSRQAGFGQLGGRVHIWKRATRAWWSNPQHRLVGTGTGRQNLVLGQFDELAKSNDRGVLARSCHSLYVNHLLGHGLIGLVSGLCLLAAMVHRAHALDIQDGTANRQALLACVLALSTATVAWGTASWIGWGSLVLAMLSVPRITDSNPRALAASAGSKRPIQSGRYDDTVSSRGPLQRVGSWHTSGKLRNKRERSRS